MAYDVRKRIDSLRSTRRDEAMLIIAREVKEAAVVSVLECLMADETDVDTAIRTCARAIEAGIKL